MIIILRIDINGLIYSVCLKKQKIIYNIFFVSMSCSFVHLSFSDWLRVTPWSWRLGAWRWMKSKLGFAFTLVFKCSTGGIFNETQDLSAPSTCNLTNRISLEDNAFVSVVIEFKFWWLFCHAQHSLCLVFQTTKTQQSVTCIGHKALWVDCGEA